MKTPGTFGTVTALSHLNAIHTLRAEYYEKLAKGTTDLDLKTLFSKMSSEAREFIVQIIQDMADYGNGTPAEVNKDLAFYSLWEKLQPSEESNKTEQLNVILEAESAVAETYKTFLESVTDLPEDTQIILSKQLHQLEHNLSLTKTARHGGVIATVQ